MHDKICLKPTLYQCSPNFIYLFGNNLHSWNYQKAASYHIIIIIHSSDRYKTSTYTYKTNRITFSNLSRSENEFIKRSMKILHIQYWTVSADQHVDLLLHLHLGKSIFFKFYPMIIPHPFSSMAGFLSSLDLPERKRCLLALPAKMKLIKINKSFIISIIYNLHAHKRLT